MSYLPNSTARTTHVGGRKVAYQDAGVPDARPVLLIHGTGGTVDTHFARTASMLGARYRVIGVQLEPANDDNLELPVLVDQVHAVANDSGVDPKESTLVGYSLGAVVAAAYAAAYRNLESLVLINGWAKTDNQQRLRHELSRHLRSSDPESHAKFAVLSAFSSRYIAERTEEELGQLVRARLQVSDTWDSHMNLNARIDILDDLPNIDARTLVVVSDQDAMVPSRHGQILFGGIRDARYASLPTGHAVALERPAQLYNLIDLFVSGKMNAGAGEIFVPEAV